MRIRIALVDDHTILREGVRSLIERDPDFVIAAEAANGREAIDLLAKTPIDVVIMDVGMQEMNGVSATENIVRNYPTTRVLALSMHTDRRFVAGMLDAGASGYLLKEGVFRELADAIRTVHAGNIYLCPKVAGLVVKDFLSIRRGDRREMPTTALTAREAEVLQLLAEGLTSKTIAYKLEVTDRTIDTYRHRIMKKLGVDSLAAPVKYAIREGLTTLDQ